MTNRWQRGALVSLLTLGLAGAVYARPQQSPGVDNEQIKWDLKRLHEDPFKLIKATPDPAAGRVRFVIEFTRAPELAELFDWEHRGGPVTFRFSDSDGVVIRTVKPVLEGELVPEKGGRIRLILPMPDSRTLEATRSITAN
jgi:hypothetical protein